jgi:hypothetical protein
MRTEAGGRGTWDAMKHLCSTPLWEAQWECILLPEFLCP